MAEIPVRVECYAGHRGEQTPRAMVLAGRRIEFAEVLDQWLAPDHRYFKLRSTDDGRFILRHDTTTGHWELTCSGAARPGEGTRRAMAEVQRPSRTISRKFRRIPSPVPPDFSGWNCTPNVRPRSATDAKVTPCVVVATASAPTGAANEWVK
jgi:hypothetical protein